MLLQNVHTYEGILPKPENFTTVYCLKLQQLLDDHSRKCSLLHEHLLPSPASLELLQALAKQFTWFGSTSLAEIFHHALYDPTYLGCFCFTEDIKIDGHCIWAPLESALPQQAGQVLSWISYTVLKCSHQIGLTNQYRLRNLLDSISHRQTKYGDNLTSTQTSQTLLLHMILSSKK